MTSKQAYDKYMIMRGKINKAEYGSQEYKILSEMMTEQYEEYKKLDHKEKGWK